MKRLWIPVLALVLCVSGFAVVADALVTSDAERIEGFLEGASRPSGVERIDAELEHSLPSEVEVRVQSSSEVQLFGAGQGEELSQWLSDEMDSFQSAEQRLLQSSTQLTAPDTARVTTRVRDTEREQTVIYTLVKHDGQWRVRHLRVL